MYRSRVGIVPLRIALLTGLGVLGVLVLAGCGGYGGYGGSSSSGGSSASGPAQVKTATATVKGQSSTILTNSQGRSLYYRTTDTASASTCTGGCASTWPPLLTSGSPVAASSLPGTLNSLSDANGTQVTYNGHLLYTYSGDSKPGDTNGEGIGGVWFVATPNLATQGSGGAAPTPTSGY
jgi:predicted lipoprotein with Yx(FWY)xxD motif